MWFGCRTQSQDLLHSTPCPDGTSSCALGITLCHVGRAVVPQGGRSMGKVCKAL